MRRALCAAPLPFWIVPHRHMWFGTSRLSDERCDRSRHVGKRQCRQQCCHDRHGAAPSGRAAAGARSSPGDCAKTKALPAPHVAHGVLPAALSSFFLRRHPCTSFLALYETFGDSIPQHAQLATSNLHRTPQRLTIGPHRGHLTLPSGSFGTTPVHWSTPRGLDIMARPQSWASSTPPGAQRGSPSPLGPPCRAECSVASGASAHSSESRGW